MNNDPISAKERRKARAMVRDISKQIQLYGEMASADEWWAFFFSCLYGQEVLDNPMRGMNFRRRRCSWCAISDAPRI
jgi:hypothetical protein